MKAFVLTLFLAVLATTGQTAGLDDSANVEQAENAIAEFSVALKSELMAAMQSGGAVNAITVCHTSSMAISEEVSFEKDMDLSRVSLKNRNPRNAPNNWQSAVLESFEARKLEGEYVNALSWHDIQDTDSGREFRYMKAIPTGGVCLRCHGRDIEPGVREKLAELYPEDKATGYRLGDIRGAFVVTRQLDY